MVTEMGEEDFKKLENPSIDLQLQKDQFKENLITAYRNIIDILKEFLDLKEEYYNIIALWTIGTYFHGKFPSFPFLFFNAQKGSGKSRVMNLIVNLARDGSLANSMTEAVLFRTTGTLAIDEFEGLTRKGGEGLRELLNSAYKRGAVVRRMKQEKTLRGSEQVVEEFLVYRPLLLANIWGMEEVLGDRCISLIIEKSTNKKITNLIEIFHEDLRIIETKKLLEQCSLCICSFSGEVYKEWNNYVKNNYILYTNNTNNTNNTNYTQVFKSINLMELNGRELELSFPLCLISAELGEDVLKETTLTLKTIFTEKRQEELTEDRDTSLIDFISQEPEGNCYVVGNLTAKFQEFLGVQDDWINSKWMGRALKRLNLIKEKRRATKGVQVILDVQKAQSKIKMFKIKTEDIKNGTG